MKTPTFDYQKKLEPIRGVILFFLILLVANLFWKFSLQGEDSTTMDSLVTFWGMNISAPFNWMAHHVALVITAILHFFGSQVSLLPANILRYPNSNSVQIVWACTGLKQAYICFCILAFAQGPWNKKIWYIPLSLFAVYVFNLIRIFFIVISIENHPGWFNFLHTYFFKYLFYGIIFLIWLYWEENFVGKESPKPKKLDQ